MKHYLRSTLASRAVNVLLVGAGGSGSRMLENLACLHRAMVALGHPGGLMVTVLDPDTVSTANVGRQAFFPSDVGSYKAITLVNRANMSLGTVQWRALVGKLGTKSTGMGQFDLVIGAVDNRSGRLAIVRSLERSSGGPTYYLDMGNKSGDGQVVLGEVIASGRKTDDKWRLPHVGELFPELIDSALDKVEDDTPSCSLAEALEKQSLYINTAMAMYAANILTQLFKYGELTHHGVFVNLDGMTAMPLEISQEAWARLGVQRTGRRQKVVQPSRK